MQLAFCDANAPDLHEQSLLSPVVIWLEPPITSMAGLEAVAI